MVDFEAVGVGASVDDAAVVSGEDGSSEAVVRRVVGATSAVATHWAGKSSSRGWPCRGLEGGAVIQRTEDPRQSTGSAKQRRSPFHPGGPKYVSPP